MSARRSRGGGRRGRHGGGEVESEERWLLTYADMLTLMFALFMVLFSISSVNISKFKTLQESLKSAFSGSILSGGHSIMQSGSESTNKHTPATAPVPAIVPLTPNVPKLQDTNAQQIGNAMVSASGTVAEQKSFEQLKRRLDSYAHSHGFAKSVVTNITRQGLVVRVLTDNLLFTSGSATLQSTGDALLNEVAHLLNIDRKNPITVEGFTDNMPIHTAQFPTNWQLSASRSVNVLLYLTAHGVDRGRLNAAGYADLHPIATNTTSTGRALNRRVDIVLDRDYPAPS
jgi:chemotaxis protein MotB